MRLSREFVDYMTHALVQRLIAAEVIQTAALDLLTTRVHQAILDELAIEDRINDKVREYMNQYAEEIRRGGLSYQEMFKRIKSELVRREKVIL